MCCVVTVPGFDVGSGCKPEQKLGLSKFCPDHQPLNGPTDQVNGIEHLGCIAANIRTSRLEAGKKPCQSHAIALCDVDVSDAYGTSNRRA